MKRVRAVSRVADAFAINHSAPRSSRQLSTASIALHRKHTNPSIHTHSLQSRFPFQPSLRHTSTIVEPLETKEFKENEALEEEEDDGLRKTPLYILHTEFGGKMVPFGGYHMPVQYEGQSISASHHFTRSHASLFDVSHMVQHKFSGPGTTAFLQRITPAGLATLAPHHSTLSTLLWPGTGGIVDDTIITRLGPEDFYVVTNAGCREKDLAYLSEQLEEFAKEGGEAVEWVVMENWGLIALQGPLSEEILSSALADPDSTNLKELYFGQSLFTEINTVTGPKVCLISRGGYTGEDGFEISIAPDETVDVAVALLEAAGEDKLQLAGLAARDSLRLEAGMCLYGHDLDDTTTPVEAGLSWVIGKDRRVEGGFHGSEVISRQLTPKSKGGAGVERRRVGLIVEGAPAREGAEVVNAEGEKIGTITSGCPSPTLGKHIAMGYIKDGFHKAGTEVEVVVRGKKRKATVTKMPFVPSKYWKGSAPA